MIQVTVSSVRNFLHMDPNLKQALTKWRAPGEQIVGQVHFGLNMSYGKDNTNRLLICYYLSLFPCQSSKFKSNIIVHVKLTFTELTKSWSLVMVAMVLSLLYRKVWTLHSGNRQTFRFWAMAHAWPLHYGSEIK